MTGKLPTGDAAIAKMMARNTEALVVNMAVEMASLKQRIVALERDAHPPINLEEAIMDVFTQRLYVSGTTVKRKVPR